MLGCALACTWIGSVAVAGTAENSFAEVSGEGIVADGDGAFGIENTEGDVSVTITPRPGWRQGDGEPSSYTHREGDVDQLGFYGLDGEESETVTISNIWKCAHEATNWSEHVRAPEIAIPSGGHSIGVYVHPVEGCAWDGATTCRYNPVAEGEHTNHEVTVECPNPHCLWHYGRPPVDNPKSISVSAGSGEGTVRLPGGGITLEDGTVLYPAGKYQVGYLGEWTNSVCTNCWCTAMTNTDWTVCKAQWGKVNEYYGLDRTDEGLAAEDKPQKTSLAVRAFDLKVGQSWVTTPHCFITGKDNGASVEYAPKRRAFLDGGEGKDFEWSRSYREEELSCTLVLTDGCQPQCREEETVITNFTVVKVDIKVKDLYESQEETLGLYSYYVPDGEPWAEEWTNALKDVTITCEPSDGVMAKQTVNVTAPDNFLWVRTENGELKKAKRRYTVEELNKTNFKFHGHQKSDTYCDGEKNVILVEHPVSGAKDKLVYTVFGRPWLVPDYDRKDGITKEKDVPKAKDGKTVFRFWINDDNDKGDDCPPADYNTDLPGGKNPNFNDSKVNGRRDLEDFTPIWIKHDELWPSGIPDEIKCKFVWELVDPVVNAVQTDFEHSSAGEFQHVPKTGCGNMLTKDSYEADKINGSFTKEFVGLMEKSEDKGVFLMEGANAGSNLVLRVKDDVGNIITQTKLLITVSCFKNMYRWLNLRGLSGNNTGVSTNLNPPANRPDEECDGKQVVFVHGFNTNGDEAQSISAEMFKRLWQSGVNSMFTGVDWYSDKGQHDLWIAGTATLEYYASVYHAFFVSKNFSKECSNLPGKKVMIGHSLGNMLVSAAAKDHDLAYEKYFMINGAVAQEAFDKNKYEINMVDDVWVSTNVLLYRSSRWGQLFDANDFRNQLSWKERFQGIHDVINCFSVSDEVVANPANGFFEGNSVWVRQEMLKGTSEIHAINAIPVLGQELTCEGGWGINTYYALRPYYYLFGFTDYVDDLSREDAIVHPLFTPFRNKPKEMMSTNLFQAVKGDEQSELRGLFLGDAIPAESHSMGANESGINGIINLGMNDNMANEELWPESHSKLVRDGWWFKSVPLWLHADVKNLAYFYTYRVFDEIKEKME